jgi:molybdate transport system substrate-binding protein
MFLRAAIFILLSACLFGKTVPAHAADAPNLTVSAAVSLKEAMTDILQQYERDTAKHVQLNIGATGQLLAQIREGAPIDVFIAASDAQMEQANKAELIDPATRTVIATNRLVLIVPTSAKDSPRDFGELASPMIKRLAIGQPKIVPAGEYAMQVLKKLDLESPLKDRLIFGSSVRQVLDYVERGEVDAGIVYATDPQQAGEGKVRVVAVADEAWHDPIRYVGAIVRETRHFAAADEFLRYLRDDAAQAIFTKRGFAPPVRQPGGPATQPTPAAAQPAPR